MEIKMRLEKRRGIPIQKKKEKLVKRTQELKGRMRMDKEKVTTGSQGSKQRVKINSRSRGQSNPGIFKMGSKKLTERLPFPKDYLQHNFFLN